MISALALPALLSLLVDPILSLVDTAYVGRGLGAINLAALGEVTSRTHVGALLDGTLRQTWSV